MLVFDHAVTLIEEWNQKGSGEGEFQSLGFGGIAVDSNNNVFVLDNGNHRIQKFDAEGKFLTSWETGADIGTTGTPEGLTIDEQGRIYVTDYALGRVQVFDNDGNLLWTWRTDSLREPLFHNPTAVAFDTDQSHFLVVNQQSNTVQVFDLP